MSTLDIATAYKYVNLQMAAEALYDFDATKQNVNLIPGDTSPYPTINPDFLTTGNEHASKFTATQAADFSKDWTVIEHKSNTTTGFSGTLFKNNKTDELVLSMRSTEFIDDSARDNKQTNEFEISGTGWAMGQIADMEAWFKELKERPEVQGQQISVTGYSLSGHLATAFNLLHQGETAANGLPLVKDVVTFNGAGVGTLAGITGSLATADGQAALTAMVTCFDALRGNSGNTGSTHFSNATAQNTAYLTDLTVTDAQGAQRSVFSTELGKRAYEAVIAAWNAAGGVPGQSLYGALDSVAPADRSSPEYQRWLISDDRILLNKAIGHAITVRDDHQTFALMAHAAHPHATRPSNMTSCQAASREPLQHGKLKKSAPRGSSGDGLRKLCRSLLLATLALPLLAACAVLPSPGLQRVKTGEALFEARCKNVAGIKIYKTVADVEGIVLLKVRPKAGEGEWSDPMWPGAAFAIEEKGDGYINTFLGFEQAFGNNGGWTPITTNSRGYINTSFSQQNPFNLPGYRYVDVVEEGTGARWRYSGSMKADGKKDINAPAVQINLKRDPNYDLNIYRWKLERVPAPAEGPRYGVTYEDHVIPEERALGLASSTVKVLDLKTNEVLGEMTMYAWTPAKPNSANPTPWLTAYRCGNNFKMGSVNSRLFVDQILQPRKDK